MPRYIKFPSYIFLFIAAIAVLSSAVVVYSHLLTEASISSADKDVIRSLHLAEKSVKLNPISIDALFTLAFFQQRLGFETQARSTLISAINLQPKNYATWEMLAIYERDLWDQHELAKEHYSVALKLNPQEKRLRKEIEKMNTGNTER